MSWIFYAIGSALFAGLTAILCFPALSGLAGIVAGTLLMVL